MNPKKITKYNSQMLRNLAKFGHTWDGANMVTLEFKGLYALLTVVVD